MKQKSLGKIFQEAMHLTSPYLGQINHLQLFKFNNKLQEFQCVLDLNCKKKEGLNNLIFSIGFQMLQI